MNRLALQQPAPRRDQPARERPPRAATFEMHKPCGEAAHPDALGEELHTEGVGRFATAWQQHLAAVVRRLTETRGDP
jgi:hypothetical protein